MKISIWQQFSSNHSASFDLVGKFQTPEAAELAAKSIQHLLNTVRAWYEKNYSEAEFEERLANERVLPLTPPEDEFRKQYGLLEWQWTNSVDWATAAYEDHVRVFGELIVLYNASETWIGSEPFDDLLLKLGAVQVDSCVEGVDARELTIDLTCIAPNEAKAVQIMQTLLDTEPLSNGTERTLIKLPNGAATRYEGKIVKDGSQVKFTELPTGILSSLMTYLESQGCTEFQSALSRR
jgi:hypothetical protein